MGCSVINLFLLSVLSSPLVNSENIVLTTLSKHPPISNEKLTLSETNVLQKFLCEILTESLSENSLLLIVQEKVLHFHWMDDILKETSKKSPLIISTTEDFDSNNYDYKVIRGYYFITVIIVYDDIITEFFSNVSKNNRWGPSQLIAISLNPKFKLDDSVFKSTVQRSEYIFVAELTYNFSLPVINTFTSFPYSRKRSEETSWKTSLGFWGEPKPKKEIFVNRFEDFGEATLKLASWCDDFPFLYFEHFENNSDCIGSNYDILLIIANKLNFTIDVQKEPVDRTWGSFINGTWSGIMGDLMYRGKDLTLNSVYITEDRVKDFDFAHPHHVEGFAFLAMLPPPIPKWRSLFLPFSYSVWLTILTVFFVVILFVYAAFRFTRLKEFYGDISAVIILVFGSFLRQSLSLHMRSRWLKLGLATWLIISWVLTTGYTSNLVSFLTAPRYPKRIETLEELAKSKLKLGIIDYGSFIVDYLTFSNSSVLQSLGKKLDLFSYSDRDYLVEKSLEERSHVHVEIHSYLVNKQRQLNLSLKSYILEEQIYRAYLAFYFPKHSPIKTPIENVLKRLIETGITTKLYLQHMEEILKSLRKTNEVTVVSPLQLEHLQACFFLLIFGWILTGLVFVTEVLVNKFY